MKSIACIFSVTLALGLVACSAPNSPNPSSAPPQANSATTNAGDNFSAQGLAGEFDGTIPCGDCQGISTKLQLNSDGSYSLSETFIGRVKDNFLSSKGSWLIQDNRHFTLIPSEQGWEHRPFEVIDKNNIKQLSKSGKPYSNDSAYHLKRAPPPPR